MESKFNLAKQDTNKSEITWLDLSEEELIKLTDVSVCMYGQQSGKGL